MKNKYIKLINKHQNQMNDFPKFFAFDEEQFKEGKEKLKVNSNTELLRIAGSGFIRKSDKDTYSKLIIKQDKELTENLRNDTFLYEGFRYELSNHEYCINHDYEETLSCFGLRYEKLTDRQKGILEKATENYLEAVQE